MEANNLKRMKIVNAKSPNPLFEKWLAEWQKEAVEQGSEAQHSLSKALRSLKKFPFALSTGKECIILDHFGKKICEKLDKKLDEYKKLFTDDEWDQVLRGGNISGRSIGDNPGDDYSSNSSEQATQNVLSPAKKPRAKKKSCDLSTEKENSTKPVEKTSSPSKKAVKGSYVPKYRSGPYAILLALLEHPEDPMEKDDLQNRAQPHCDVSFTKPLPESRYTAWSSMSTLLKKELVIRSTKPIRFQLSATGKQLAESLVNASGSMDTQPASTPSPAKSTQLLSPNHRSQTQSSLSNDLLTDSENYSENLRSSQRSDLFERLPSSSSSQVASNFSQPSSSTSGESQVLETVIFSPKTFDIILLVDIRETEMKGKERVDATVQSLQRRKINCETRHLTMGDFAWICRDRITAAELVLPYVMERKRMDDLASSVKDGRFHEQKFRLKQCGIPNIIYLVEQYGKDNQRLGLPLATLQQAAINTQFVDGFTVNYTKSHDESMAYVACLTQLLVKMFHDKTLVSCAKSDLPELNLQSDLISLMYFKEFNRSSTKMRNWCVKDMLIKQLIQLKGLSVEKATAIANKYPTPSLLISALTVEGPKAIADLHAGPQAKVGPTFAAAVHGLYTNLELQ